MAGGCGPRAKSAAAQSFIFRCRAAADAPLRPQRIVPRASRSLRFGPLGAGGVCAPSELLFLPGCARQTFLGGLLLAPRGQHLRLTHGSSVGEWLQRVSVDVVALVVSVGAASIAGGAQWSK